MPEMFTISDEESFAVSDEESSAVSDIESLVTFEPGNDIKETYIFFYLSILFCLGIFDFPFTLFIPSHSTRFKSFPVLSFFLVY